MPKKLKTNEDLVRDLMNYSPHGALCQAFIMQAIQEFARQVAAKPASDFDSGFMHGATWVGVAKDVIKRCDAFYGRHETQVVTD